MGHPPRGSLGVVPDLVSGEQQGGHSLKPVRGAHQGAGRLKRGDLAPLGGAVIRLPRSLRGRRRRQKKKSSLGLPGAP